MSVRIYLLVLFTVLCSAKTKSNPTDTTIAVKNGSTDIAVHLKWPQTETIKGTLVLLPGWKLPVTDWCTKTSLCKKALADGYILIMPEMAKSIYASQLYPETRQDWKIFATRTWFTDTLIKHIQNKYKLLLPGQENFILGLSTGARGAALLCLDCPAIFKKGAGLSGDYDQTKMPKDALMTGFYGPIDKFLDRWTGYDNITFRFKELIIPFYLAHGKADKIVPYHQTLQLCDSLLKHKPALIKCHINDTAAHNYPYWDSEVNNVLFFFKQQINL